MELYKWIITLFVFFEQSEAHYWWSGCDYEKIWRMYKKVHNKRYDEKEDARRRAIFEETVCRIAKHNREYDLGLQTYRRGLTKHSDLLNEEFGSRLNGFWGHPECRKNSGPRKEFERTMRPENFPRILDYRREELVTPVKDQGACGACWAFSAIASLESHTKKATSQTVLLNEQTLVDCSGPYGNRGCQGGLITLAFEYIRENGGIDSETSNRFRTRGNCRLDASALGATLRDYAELNEGNETDLLDVLVNVGPISVGIDASLQSFQDYKDGIYDDPECNNEYLNHAVLLIGYGTENGVDFWLIKNSYGTSWGENGYAKIARNKNNQCGIATQATYPIV